jgi:hypothetical protein
VNQPAYGQSYQPPEQPQGQASGQRKGAQLLALLLLLGAVVTVLWLLLRPGSTCGDGTCGSEETFATCASDCPAKCGNGSCEAPAENAANCPADCKGKPTCGDGKCESPAETLASCPADCAPKGCGNGTCDAGETAATCPIDCQPVGRCRDPAFRKMLARIVKDCEGACGFEAKNPVVGLDEAQFEALFADAGKKDPGYGTHFALFGCNVYNDDKSDCQGFDSFYAEASACPEDSAYECATRASNKCNAAGAQDNCKKYAGALDTGFRQFIDQWQAARYFVLLGTASRSGNTRDAAGAESMSDGNRTLALRRAGNAQTLLSKLRADYAGKGKHLDGKAFRVVLDNTKQFFDKPSFVQMVEAQLATQGKLERGFVPTGKGALNRSVMLLAIQCDLSAEGVE